MRRQAKENINTAEYYDQFFKEHDCTKDRVLRQEIFLKYVKEGKIIELASGLSYFLQMAKKKYPKSEVWGIDFSVTAKERMSKEESSPEESVNYVLGNALDTPFKDNYFDSVVSGEFIEHLEKPQELVDEMYRLCKPGGIMVLSTPHLETNDPEHLWEFNPGDILKLFEKYSIEAKYELLKSDISDRYYIIMYANK